MQNGPQMTATEVVQRNEEKMRLLGPVLGRLQSELLRPMIDRTFAILLRKKLFFNFYGTMGKSIKPGEIGQFEVNFSYPPRSLTDTGSSAAL